jgi:hypothetical protein
MERLVSPATDVIATMLRIGSIKRQNETITGENMTLAKRTFKGSTELVIFGPK